jgi:tetratricopeptide (TPR) repeat protein
MTQQSTSRRLDDALNAERLLEWPVALQHYMQLRTAPDRVDRCRALIGLARCLLQTRNRGETDEAGEALEEARALAAEIGDPSLEGQRLIQWGHIQEHQGYLQRALEFYTTALGLLPKDGSYEYVEASLTLASAERRRGELELALSRLRDLGSLNLESHLQAEYQDELGAVLIARGEYAGAIVELRRGLELDETANNGYAGARSQLLLAEALRQTGELSEARRLIDEAVVAYKEQGATLGLSEAYAQLGLWHEDSESYESALHAFQDSLKQDELSDDRVGQARAKRHMARVFRKSGDSPRAHELLEDARDVLSREDHIEMALLWQEEAELSLTGAVPNYKRAIERFSRACDVAVEDGDERAIAIAQRHLARAYREDDDLQKAEDLLRKAQPALEQRGDLRELDELLDDLGEVLLEQDRYADAKEVLEHSLALDENLGRVSSKARSLLLLGQVAHESGDQDGAQRYLEQAMAVYSEVKQDVGLSEVLQHMAAWHLDRGQATQAISLLRKGLTIDSRLDDPLGRARARRLLAAAYRQRGDFERADEYLSEARQDLAPIDDPVERALVDCEHGRIDLARGEVGAAADRLCHAQKVFEDARHRPVDVATCERLRATAAAHQGFYSEALELLDRARAVFEERGDIPELDDLHDDLAEVWLMQGRLDLARASANDSLAIGGPTGGWSFGRGRSLLLLAEINMHEGGEGRASSRECIEEALKLYEDQANEAGRCHAFLALGDWHMAEHQLSDAMTAYKTARSRAHHLRDLHKAATCNRKLAAIHLERHEVQRAEDALRDATENLGDISDPRALAPLDLEWGRLSMAKGQHSEATRHLRRAVDGFQRLRQEGERRAALQLLSTCLQADGQTGDALECVREMGSESTFMYNVLIKDLHPRIAQASRPNFENGNFKEAVNNAFGAVELMIKEETAKLKAPPAWTADFAKHVNILLAQTDSWGDGIRGKKKGTQLFGDFITGSKEFFYNPSKHDNVAFSPVSAFAAIATAHVIAETVEHHELPWLTHSDG